MAQVLPEDRLTRLEMAIEKLGTGALEVAATAASRPGSSSNCSNAGQNLATAEEGLARLARK